MKYLVLLLLTYIAVEYVILVHLRGKQNRSNYGWVGVHRFQDNQGPDGRQNFSIFDISHIMPPESNNPIGHMLKLQSHPARGGETYNRYISDKIFWSELAEQCVPKGKH